MPLKKISSLHFLTPQPIYSSDFFLMIEQSLKAGIDWIQYRDKNNDDATFLKIAKEVMALCKNYHATFIINDRVEIAQLLNADGVHVGQSDLTLDIARKIMGEQAIIGVSTNTAQQIIEAQNNGADYVGFGPFQFTTTRKNLNPIVGLEGYEKLFLNNAIKIPVVAIGGIEQENIIELKKTGVTRFAISGAIAHSNNPSEIIKKLRTSIDL